MDLAHFFTRFSNAASRLAGNASSFVICLALILIWGLSGSFFHFSDTWQLVINTSTTIVTFLMVFLIQNTQNRDGAAIQAKLDELILVSTGENRFIGIEKLTQQEVDAFRVWCEERAISPERFGDSTDPANTVAIANARARKAADNAV
jgi:low affinity Fe/Cu permease